MDPVNVKPAVEFVITPEFVGRLLAEQCPDLAGLPLGESFEGWDAVVTRLGDELAVRLPRTRLAGTVVEKELALLPAASRGWDFATSTIVRAGAPTAAFPVPWTVVRWVPGIAALQVPLAVAAAQPLGRAIRQVHREAPVGAPATVSWSHPLEQHGSTVLARIDAVAAQAGAGTPVFDAVAARALWTAAVETPLDEPLCLVHGDLHGSNVMSDGGRFAGIVDWGDMGVGEPAVDLGYAWLLLPAGTMPALIDGYGGASAATQLRARAVGLGKALELVLFDDQRVRAAGWQALANLGLAR